MNEIVFDGEGDTVDAGAAVMVVIERTVIIVMMIALGRVFVIVATFVLRVAAGGMDDRGGGEDTGVESGEDAENQ